MAVKSIKVNVGRQQLGARNTHSMSAAELGYATTMRRRSKEITDQLINILEQFEGVAEDVMIEALEPTFEKSQEYCPIDTGRLRASGYLEKTGSKGQPRVEMGYARGGNPYYAALVHENTFFRHAPPTKAKFLQDAVFEDLPAIYYRVASLYRGWAGT